MQPHTPALRAPKAYLATVAKHLLINHLRRQSLERAWLAALAALPEQHVPSTEQRAEVLQALQAVDAMLDGLARHLARQRWIWRSGRAHAGKSCASSTHSVSASAM